MDITTCALVVGILFVILWALGSLYWSSPKAQATFLRKKQTLPKTIDLELFKKYNKEIEVEVSDNEVPLIRRYASTGLMQTGLNENAKLTAKLSTRGKRLLD